MSTQSDQTMTGESKMGLKQKQEEYLGEKNQGFQDSTSHQAGQGLSSKGNPKEGEKSDVYIPEKSSKGGMNENQREVNPQDLLIKDNAPDMRYKENQKAYGQTGQSQAGQS